MARRLHLTLTRAQVYALLIVADDARPTTQEGKDRWAAIAREARRALAFENRARNKEKTQEPEP